MKTATVSEDPPFPVLFALLHKPEDICKEYYGSLEFFSILGTTQTAYVKQTENVHRNICLFLTICVSSLERRIIRLPDNASGTGSCLTVTAPLTATRTTSAAVAALRNHHLLLQFMGAPKDTQPPLPAPFQAFFCPSSQP